MAEWIKELPKGQENLIVGIDRGGGISLSSMGSGQVNRIFKRIARNAGLDELIIEGISGHSMRLGAAQDFLSSGANHNAAGKMVKVRYCNEVSREQQLPSLILSPKIKGG